MTSRSRGEAPDLTISLLTAGLPLRLVFTPAHADLVDELRVQWAHQVVPATAWTEVARGAADAAPDPPIVLEFVTEPVPESPKAVLLRPGPFASYAVSGMVTRAVIRALVGERLLLHAGAVELPDLGVVVLVGASGAGKSTATTRLGRRGKYFTDELTILEPRSGALTPYPKPVSLRALQEVGKRDVALSELDLSVGTGGEAPQWVVLLERILPGRESELGLVRRVPLAEAVLRIVAQSSSIWEVPGGLAALADVLNAAGGALDVAYHEAEEIERLLSSAPEPIVEAFEQVAGDRNVREPGPGQYAVTPFDEALLLDAGAIVLTERKALHVSGLGQFVWEVLKSAGSLSVDQLEARLTELLGIHPEQSVWLERSLADLVEQGLIRGGGHYRPLSKNRQNGHFADQSISTCR